jgi:hypothetical protein
MRECSRVVRARVVPRPAKPARQGRYARASASVGCVRCGRRDHVPVAFMRTEGGIPPLGYALRAVLVTP